MKRIPLTAFAAPASLTLALHEAIFTHFRQHGNDGAACEQILAALANLAADYEHAVPGFRWKLARKLTEPRGGRQQ